MTIRHYIRLAVIAALTLQLLACSTYKLQNASASYAPVNHGKIEYYKVGHGSPIVLIPGYSVDVSSWDQQFINTLASKHTLIIINNRGVGGSIIKSDHYEANDLANDTWQLIQDLHLKKPTILGISMGGMITQELAILHPSQIGAIVLINTAIAGDQSVHPSSDIEEKMKVMPKYKITRLASALQMFFPLNESPEVTYELIQNRFIPTDYKESDTTGIMPTQMNLVLHWVKNNSAARQIATLPMPALILSGQADIIIPPVNSDILAHTIPHAQLTRWKNGGHGMIFQYPISIAKTVNQFLSRQVTDINSVF